MAFFSKHYHSPGTAPGTLHLHPPIAGVLCHVRLVRYGPSMFSISEGTEFVPVDTPDTDSNPVTWLHVQGRPSGHLLTQIGEHFQLHSLPLEDVHNTGQRPKVEEFDGQMFAVLSLPRFENGEVEVHQASFFFTKDCVLSFCEGPIDPFEPVLKRLQEGLGKLRSQRADYLLYTLLDTVVDQGFPVLEAFGRELEDLEEKIIETAARETLLHIHRVKRELILLRRMLWPQREVINTLVRDEHDLISDETRVFLRDCYDHTIQVIELLETYRDISVSMLDIYLSSVNNHMNEIMRVLTMIATIFIPLSFVAGVYGMNFGNNSKSPWAMPELNWYFGYPLVWLLMIFITGGMLIYFRRKHWM